MSISDVDPVIAKLEQLRDRNEGGWVPFADVDYMLRTLKEFRKAHSDSEPKEPNEATKKLAEFGGLIYSRVRKWYDPQLDALAMRVDEIDRRTK